MTEWGTRRTNGLVALDHAVLPLGHRIHNVVIVSPVMIAAAVAVTSGRCGLRLRRGRLRITIPTPTTATAAAHSGCVVVIVSGVAAAVGAAPRGDVGPQRYGPPAGRRVLLQGLDELRGGVGQIGITSPTKPMLCPQTELLRLIKLRRTTHCMTKPMSCP